jgi:hypothetical protein
MIPSHLGATGDLAVLINSLPRGASHLGHPESVGTPVIELEI